MKTIGLIGGMSWESSVTYYQVINQVIKEQLGGLHSAKCILYSVDFYDIEQCQANNDWDKSVKILSDAALSLSKAGADFIVICTNTMHKVVDVVQADLAIPIIHIAQTTQSVLKKSNITKVAFLGTKYTMEQDFYKKIIANSGIEIVIPDNGDRKVINDIIFQELCLGIMSQHSNTTLLTIIEKLGLAGVQGIILGCTELGLLINQSDTSIALFDTSLIHAKFAALYALDKAY